MYVTAARNRDFAKTQSDGGIQAAPSTSALGEYKLTVCKLVNARFQLLRTVKFKYEHTKLISLYLNHIAL